MLNWLLVSSTISTIIMIFIGGLLLWLTAKYFFRLKDTTYKTALIVAAIVGVVGWIFSLTSLLILSLATVLGVISFLVSVILGIYLVKKFYKQEWGKAALVWLVWFILYWIVSLIIGLVLALIIGTAVTTQAAAYLAA